MTTRVNVTLDCVNLERIAEFWIQALGYDKSATSREPYLMLIPNDGTAVPWLCLQRVPEPKAGKNRMHFDLNVDDIDETMDRLIALGATRRTDEVLHYGQRWFVMADPEGNEFCVIAKHDEPVPGL